MKTRVIRTESKVNKCFCCEKDLIKDEHDTIYDAGYAELGFHYGSTLDQCHGHAYRKDKENPDPLQNILMADIIELYICDDCFKKKHHLCNGYDDLRIDYGKLKAEQVEILKDLAAWFRSDEGKAEHKESMMRLRKLEIKGRVELKNKIHELFTEVVSTRNKGLPTSELEEQLAEYKRQYEETMSR